jgi:heme/copper-type cytochrome/quinol oxidase subunit 3
MIAQPHVSSNERVPSSVLGMLLFVASELMFFAGLISAFTISRAGSTDAMWITASAPLLPAAATAVNTTALMLSGVCVFVAYQQYRRHSSSAARTLLAGWLLGAMFVVLQGREWVGLLAQGLTMYSSGLGAFFYLIVGVHAIHAVAALAGLGVAWQRLKRGSLTPGFFLGAQTFWYFVVGVWPVIYLRVYF